MCCPLYGRKCPLWSANRQYGRFPVVLRRGKPHAITKHRVRNQDVNNFWNEIESMCNNNEEQRLESERTLRTCHVNISNKTQCMMENIAEETAEAHLATTKEIDQKKKIHML
ncbi:hypothetical protein RclHR1_09830005 [Rhizophagus clarus]|uniref:Uncharacterized protein n=1 Tax=Rhizophagus clarus TaxID=94130 RepID=A0A2Z6S5X3_9GLOM|nr:hypothetical protein RclHR1_09830005 [Rhizophagus clarus]